MIHLIGNKHSGHGPDGRRLYFKGGGGGGQVKYDNLERLYDEQAASARLLRGIAEQNLPGATQAYVGNVQNVLAPGYANRQANMAGADMASANAMERAATERNLASMGVNPNDPRFAGSLRSTQVNNAARMAAGKNVTRNQAEQYQLNVAKDAVGTFTGQSNNAATQMGNAASGLGSVYSSQANQKMAQDQAQANAVGNVANAGLTAYAMFAKDGGKVPSLAMLADGGNVAQSYDDYAATQTSPTASAGRYQGITPEQWSAAAAPKPAQQAQSAPTFGGGLYYDKSGAVRYVGQNDAMFGPRFISSRMSPELRAAKLSYAGLTALPSAQMKDGGKVVERHMVGGQAGSQQNQGFFQMQSIAPPPTAQAPQQQGGGVGMTDLMMAKKIADKRAANAAADAAGSAFAKDVAANSAGMAAQNAGLVGDAAVAGGSASAGAGLSSMAGAEAAGGLASATNGALMSTGIDAAATGALSGSITSGAAATGAGTLAGGASTLAGGAGTAGAAAGAGAMGAIGAALPWVGAAYAVGSLLDWWNEGGKVGTQNAGMSEQEAMQRFEQAEVTGTLADLRAGGRTPGEWVENRDTVPAMLVSGEQVLNSEASKLLGDKDAEKLNKKGLDLRAKGKTPKQIKTVGLAGLESMV